MCDSPDIDPVKRAELAEFFKGNSLHTAPVQPINPLNSPALSVAHDSELPVEYELDDIAGEIDVHKIHIKVRI